MSRLFRPENAQKRAREFLEVGKPTRALDVLYEVIRRGKMRNNCSEKVLEPIMFMYLELCVDLKRSHLAKEGLYQYRNIFQSVNVSTLETVVRRYLELAEERTEAARKQSHDAVSSVSVDDLDILATPEELLLKAVSGEDAQDRSDRTILTPWVKFLWESYRQCLELLRNNSRVEKLYHEIAKKAFNFCERYQRKTEFRKLCDNLLNHLQHLQKPPTSATAVSLSNPETQQMNLETRLEQLNYAIKMELWQEAYRAIEYVSDLMGKSKKSPKPQIMASYYQKLALVFWKAGNQLFHAAALLKLFQLNKEQKKNITLEEVSKKAAVVLVATLAIPLPSAHPEFDRFIETEKSAMEKISKLAQLLSLQKPPTRISLFKELSRCGVISAVVPELQNLYKLMEVTFDPLNLCPSMKAQLTWVSEQSELQQYIPSFQEMTVTRLIKQVAQIYSSVTFEWLLKAAVFMTAFQLERILVDLVRHNDLQIRVDHRLKCVHFGSALSDSQREDLPEGPTLQPMPSETIRCQLVFMNNALTKCMQLIAPDARKKEMESVRRDCIQAYNQNKNKDHTKILNRQYTIEMRKERLESQTQQREESIRKAQEEQQQKQKLEEQERLKREATEREKQRQEEQLKQIHTKQIKDKLLQISQTSYGQKMIEKFNEEELLNLDADEILQRQVEELEKERKELQGRLKGQEKKVDYMERAKRIIEIPKFKDLYEKQKLQDREFWRQEEDKRIKKMVEEHRRSLEICKRFNHMKGDLGSFLDGLKSARRSETEKKMNDFNARLEVERKTRLLERKENRRKDRRESYLRERREEEQRRMDEELKKEREAKEAEELERQKKEEEEYIRKKDELDRQEKLRKEKEMEIERKIREKETAGPPATGGAPGPWRGGNKDSRGEHKEIPPRGESESHREEDGKPGIWRPSQGSGAWRDKEQEKLSVWRKKDEDDSESSAGEAPKRERGDRDIRLEERASSREERSRDDRFVNREGNRDERYGNRDDRYGNRDDRFGSRDDRYGNRESNRDDRYGSRDDRYGNRGGERSGGSGYGDRDRNRGDFQRGEDSRRGAGGDYQRGGGSGGFRRGDGEDFRRGGGEDFRRGAGEDFRRGGGEDFRRGGGDDFRRGAGGSDDFNRGGGGGGGGGEGEWRRGGTGEGGRGGAGESRRGGAGEGVRSAPSRDVDRRPAPRGEDEGAWRKDAPPSNSRRDEDDRRGGDKRDGGERRGGVGGGESAWRRGGAAGGGGGGAAPSASARVGKEAAAVPPPAPKREKPAPETDADGWTKVRK